VRVLRATLPVVAGLAIFAGTLEAALRIVPRSIPTTVLLRFEPGLRTRIARGRFSTHDETILLERDDGGPKLRVWRPFIDKLYEIDDPGSRRVVTTDEIGFCNPPGTYRATPALDLLAIGDSFTWCHAIDAERTWASLVGRLTGLPSYNLGRGGQGPYEYVQILKRFGLSRSPRAVMLNVFEGNDLRDSEEFHRFRLDPSGAEAAPPPGWRGQRLARASYAYNVLRGGIDYLAEHGAQSRLEAEIDFRYRIGTDEHGTVFNRSQSDREEVLYARRVRAGHIDLALFDEALASFAELARRHRFEPIVLYTPSAHTVYREHVSFFDPAIADDLRRFSDAQRRHLATRAADLGYRFLDLTPHLRAAISGFEPGELLYFPTTLHYSPPGHEVVARAVAGLLVEIGVADPAAVVDGPGDREPAAGRGAGRATPSADRSTTGGTHGGASLRLTRPPARALGSAA